VKKERRVLSANMISRQRSVLSAECTVYTQPKDRAKVHIGYPRGQRPVKMGTQVFGSGKYKEDTKVLESGMYKEDTQVKGMNNQIEGSGFLL
jgi:hypothetical protein